ncbi:MAG: hypothetical protein FJX47_01415 [Alphaproteobacteria bacterium]|nr:hypothetical protein [Alphaproteobacteria bacterium]
MLSTTPTAQPGGAPPSAASAAPAPSVPIAPDAPDALAAASPLTPATAPRRKPRRRMKWKQIARMVAEGASTEDVRFLTGCEPEQLARVRATSQRFRRWFDAARRQHFLDCALQAQGIRREMVTRLRGALDKGDARFLQWASEAVDLFNRAGVEELAGKSGQLDELDLAALIAEGRKTLESNRAPRDTEIGASP